MGLFDDIIKKNTPAVNPTSPMSGDAGDSSSSSGASSGGNPPTPQVVIQKTSEETVFGQADDDKLSVPPAVTVGVQAETDTSSILMNAPQVNTPTQAQEVVAPTTPPSASLFINVGTPSAPTTESNSMIMPTASEPMATPIIQPAAEPAPSTAVSLPNSNLLETVIGATPLAQNDPLLPTETVAAIEETPAVATPVHTGNFATPKDFIEKSLEGIAKMLQNIDERHSAKITEAEGYKAEKLRFTDLERDAYHEASVMDKERDHAVHMKKILETELARDEANRAGKEFSTHVESTLSEIGHEHPISHAKQSHKKHDTHESEPALMAS